MKDNLNFKSIKDFENYISKKCIDNFGFDCNPFTLASCFLYVTVPYDKVTEVKEIVFNSISDFSKCNIQESRHFSKTKVLEFIP